jgi:hemoglobin-like flavoprotein
VSVNPTQENVIGESYINQEVISKMSISSSDVEQYYPSYVNTNPSISTEQFRSIQESWKMIRSGEYVLFKEQTLVTDPIGFWGLQFYDVLFEMEPAAKLLFKNKFQQGKMLTEMVGAALALLPGTFDEMLGEERVEIDPKLIPILQALAERHVQYQTKAKHYSSVGLAIVTTFERMLGDRFDPNTKAAWIELWSLICSVMIPAHVKQAQQMGVEI